MKNNKIVPISCMAIGAMLAFLAMYLLMHFRQQPVVQTVVIQGQPEPEVQPPPMEEPVVVAETPSPAPAAPTNSNELKFQISGLSLAGQPQVRSPYTGPGHVPIQPTEPAVSQ